MGSAAMKIIQWIDENQGEIIRIAEDLIRIPTISGRPDANLQYEAAAAYLHSEFASIGIPSCSHQLGPNGGTNVVATLNGSSGGKTLALGGHMDVVAADEPDWNIAGGFAPVVTADGKLVGRGAADMKGGLAACLVAMKALQATGTNLNGNMQFVATVDEEIGGPCGMDYLVKSGTVLPDFFINAEQTEMDIITAYKGCCWIQVVVKGVSAHGSRPDLGVNAVEKAAGIIKKLRAKGLTWQKDFQLGECTVNVGQIHGGTATNVVPDECIFSLDVRLVPGQTYDGVLGEIRGIIATMQAQDPGLVATADFCSRCTNAVVLSNDSELVKTLREKTAQVTGNVARIGSFIAAGDNCLFHKMQIPALMYGPGSLQHVHKANEYVLVSELVLAAKIYALAALTLCQ